MVQTQLNLFGITKKKKSSNKSNHKGNRVVSNDALWGEMQSVYSQIANYCPISLFNNGIEYEDCNGLRIWYDSYTNEAFIHNGAIYPGKAGLFISAEIIGTERLTIEKRFKIHSILLEQLKQGKTITEALRCASFV